MTEPDQRFKFPKHLHLRTPAEFQHVYSQKNRAGDQALLMFVAANELSHARVGLSVSKRSHGKAVRRNRIRRLLKEAFRLEQHNLPGGIDIVIVPRPADSLDDLLPVYRRSLVKLAKKLAKRIERESISDQK